MHNFVGEGEVDNIGGVDGVDDCLENVVVEVEKFFGHNWLSSRGEGVHHDAEEGRMDALTGCV